MLRSGHAKAAADLFFFCWTDEERGIHFYATHMQIHTQQQKSKLPQLSQKYLRVPCQMPI
jgi:hypothetical protein